jgi:hypothetical protein
LIERAPLPATGGRHAFVSSDAGDQSMKTHRIAVALASAFGIATAVLPEIAFALPGGPVQELKAIANDYNAIVKVHGFHCNRLNAPGIGRHYNPAACQSNAAPHQYSEPYPIYDDNFYYRDPGVFPFFPFFYFFGQTHYNGSTFDSYNYGSANYGYRRSMYRYRGWNNNGWAGRPSRWDGRSGYAIGGWTGRPLYRSGPGMATGSMYRSSFAGAGMGPGYRSSGFSGGNRIIIRPRVGLRSERR